MNDRQRMLAAIRGETPDRFCFVPRLEFWYRARHLDHSMPPDLASLTLMEITDRLGVGYYAVTPDYTDYTGDEMVDRAIGLADNSVLPFKVTLEDVDRRVLSYGRRTEVEYHTPAGSIRTSCEFTDEMIAAGASDPYITRHAINSPGDFAVVGHIFSHLKVEPRLSGYLAMRERVGERGIVVACASGFACPMQHILAELMPMEQFYYALHDCPAAVQRLAEQMEPYYQAVETIAADSPAEVVLLGSNYDESLTPPPFFRKYLLSPLREYADVLHRRGKYLLTHTDGENRLLLPLYLEAGFDVADSLCPYPMTRCRLEEIREAFADRITILGGIPSTLLCPDKASFGEFRQFIDDLVARYGHQSHFVLGVSDMVTADAEWDRVRYIADTVASLG
jgi:hypothetical protein